MPNPAVATVASSAVSLVGGIKSNKSASKLDKQATAAEQAQLDFAKQQYEDWKGIFGPIQDNLAAYYNNLTPNRIEAQGKQAIELQRDQWLSRIEEDFAARGLTNSALQGSAVSDVERSTAMAKAEVAATAPEKAAQQKLNFLQIGYGQNPMSNVQSVLNSQASGLRDRATEAQNTAGSALGTGISAFGTALGDYFGGGKK